MAKSDTAEYTTWKNMRGRCNRKPTGRDRDEKYFKLQVCERWNIFDNFLEDMGYKPTPKHTIERKDNRKGYSPDNCVWASPLEQARNHTKRKDNTTGVTGVTFTGKGYRSHWQSLDGKQKSKFFSIKKYGDELAFFAACECREQMIELLNKNGAGYGENHGK